VKSESYPVDITGSLLAEVRQAAKQTGLSIADAMRESMKLGLPKLVQQVANQPDFEGLTPMTDEECRQCWEIPDPEFDALAAHCASLPVSEPEED
jgi:hypothetical protein